MDNLVRLKRIKCGFFQYYIAKELGVSTKTLQRIESGTKEPTEKEYEKLAKIFNCSVEELRQEE